MVVLCDRGRTAVLRTLTEWMVVTPGDGVSTDICATYCWRAMRAPPIEVKCGTGCSPMVETHVQIVALPAVANAPEIF
jgi:hypothetical protein